ncbi:hypothetical protein [Amaricoccus macauensis]|uniref:hypothetical protein n=1 Tax=Amaricoccus macauensis TaxID=57001 RepID=UPI003C7D3BFE
MAHQLDRVPNDDIAGKTIAITVGSYEIMGLVEIIRALVAGLKGYGITEESTGAEIRSSMEVLMLIGWPTARRSTSIGSRPMPTP